MFAPLWCYNAHPILWCLYDSYGLSVLQLQDLMRSRRFVAKATQSQSSGSEHFSWGGTTSECPGELSVRPSVYCGLSEFPGPVADASLGPLQGQGLVAAVT